MQELTIISGNTNQTPIEIALGIDENGMTTAMKLYEFLQMDKSNYSRWCKRNITDNPFAEENVDFWAFVRNDEWGGQATTDYRLTAKFAKKLSMMQKNERGEQAREYFTKVEDMAVNITKSANNALILELETLKKEILTLRNGLMVLQSVTNNSRTDEMTISDIKRIKAAVVAKVVQTLGGMNSNAYKKKSLMQDVFANVYYTTNKAIGVRTYKHIRSNQVAEYIDIIGEYTPSDRILKAINECNEQED